ncbi:MAG TPA: GAF domain-containing protein, partial [Aggregicoccus sp.]|nr:GAF domain-containing protein [Aggregicoccus sp.]
MSPPRTPDACSPPAAQEERAALHEPGPELDLLLGVLSQALPSGANAAQGAGQEGLAYFDAEGRHRYVSDPYAAHLGASAAELLGRGLREVLGEAAAPVEDGPLRRALGGESAHWEGTLQGAAPLQLRCVPHARADGTLAGVLALLSGAGEQTAQGPAARAQVLAGASDALAASLDLRATLGAISALAVPALADWCVVDVLADDGRLERLEVAHADPAHAHLAARVRALAPVHPALSPDGLRAGRVQVLEDVGEGEHALLLQGLRPRSLLMAPLRSRGRRLGMLTLLVNEASERRYLPADARMGEELARRVSLALDNALLHRAAQEARERTERLQAVTAALSEAVSPAEVADVIATQGTLALGADAGVVLVLSGDGRELRLASARGYSAETLTRWSHLPLELSTPLTDAVRLPDVVQLPTLAEREASYPRQPEEGRAAHSALSAVALRAGARVMGVVGLSFLAERTLTPPERELLLALARQGGQALERARLYEAERRARREAQEALRAGELARTQLAASEARFRRVVDSGMLGICFWDGRGRVTDANAVFLGMVGRSRAELGALRLDALFPEPLAHEELERRGVHAPYETELARAD